MTGLFSLTTRKPLAILLSALILAGIGSAATSVAFDPAPAYAGTNDDSI